MTTLIYWVAIDSRGPASVYLASDSRISWGGQSWDHGIKLYTPNTMPDLFGYCGDVIYPTMILTSLCYHIDKGIFFTKDCSFEEKFEKVNSFIKENFKSYPKDQKRNFKIIHISRSGEGMKAMFHGRQLSFENNSFTPKELFPKPELLKQSSLIVEHGSGADAFKNGPHKTWQASDVKGTSRSIFSSLCDSLDDGTDKQSGGPPQLIGLYRIGEPKIFGIIWKDKRYVTGIEQSIDKIPLLHNIEWRNRQFEICDPITTLRREGAQAQPRPTSLAPKK